MPKIETKDGFYDSGKSLSIINLDAKVGISKSNLSGDVMVIQALLKFIREGDDSSGSWDFAPSSPPMPEPDGIFRAGELDRWIKVFQKACNADLSFNPGLNSLTEDGAASRARGDQVAGSGKKWTIIELNERADWLTGYENNHIAALTARFPQLYNIMGAELIGY